MTPTWVPIVAVALTVVLALIGYARIWGHIERQLKHVSDRSNETAQAVKDLGAKMLTQSDLNLAIANVRIEVLRETMQREREQRERTRRDGEGP